MEEKRYYFSNYPTGYLLALLEQTNNKLILLQAKNIKSNSELSFYRINYLKLLTTLMKECLTSRYLKENKSLTEYGKMLINAKKETEKDILKDVFTTKLLEKKSLISITLLNNVLEKLDIDHLQKIIDNDTNSMYTYYAKIRFDEVLFQVDDEVEEELKEKIKNDRGYLR